MTLQLSTPVKIIALVGVALVLGIAGLATLALGHSGPAKAAAKSPSAPAVHVFTTKPSHTVVHHARPAIKLDPSLPAPLRRSLLHSRVVVAAAWAPGIASETTALAAARTAARSAHVGFAALNVADEPTAAALASYAPNAAGGSVLVIRRPGKVVVEIDGATDVETITQAAAQAR